MIGLGINNSVVRGIAVPNYSNAYKEQSAMIFIPSRYTHIYYSIVKKAQQRSTLKSVYTESHHIIPKSLGGSDDKTNLVDLTYKEHRLCHKLLVKMTQGKAKGKMAYALLFFRVSESTKKSLVKSFSDYRKSLIPITNGIIDKWISKEEEIPQGFYHGFSPATVKKHGDGNRGKKWITNGIVSYQIKDNILPEGFYWGQTEYHKEKNSKSLQGKLNPMYGKSGEFHPAYGYKHSDEMIQHLSLFKQGNKNPMYGKLPHNAKSIEVNGISYNSVSEARQRTGLSRRTVEKLYKEKK